MGILIDLNIDVVCDIALSKKRMRTEEPPTLQPQFPFNELREQSSPVAFCFPKLVKPTQEIQEPLRITTLEGQGEVFDSDSFVQGQLLPHC